MLNAIRLKDIDYDLNMIALEDTDLCVRNIINGNQNIKLNHFIFYAPKHNKGKGIRKRFIKSRKINRSKTVSTKNMGN